MPRPNRLGHPGITYNLKTGKFQVVHRGRYAGVFPTLELAVEARDAAERRLGNVKRTVGKGQSPNKGIRHDPEVIPRSFKRKKRKCSKCQKVFRTTPRRRMLCYDCFKNSDVDDCSLAC